MTNTARVRIGKIKMKAGGAEVRILPRQSRDDGENYKGLIVNHARMIADDDKEMVGFVVIGIFADGTYNEGSRLDAGAAIGRTMLPSYIAEIVRRSALMEPIAHGEI